MHTVTLEQLKSDSNLRAAWANKLVYIWSNQWNLYWRANGRGYTSRVTDGPGVYDFSDAWRRTAHCGPEKGIEFEEVKS